MFLLSSSRVNGVGKITYVGSSLPLTVEQADRCVATFFSKNGGSCSLDKKSWGREFIQFVFSVCLVYVCVCGAGGGWPPGQSAGGQGDVQPTPRNRVQTQRSHL